MNPMCLISCKVLDHKVFSDSELITLWLTFVIVLLSDTGISQEGHIAWVPQTEFSLTDETLLMC